MKQPTAEQITERIARVKRAQKSLDAALDALQKDLDNGSAEVVFGKFGSSIARDYLA